MASEAIKIPFVEGAAPSTPAANRAVIYVKSDGLFYSKDDAGVETLMSSGASGNVATDAIWDAAGDLVQGTGANTAAKLSAGTAGQLLKSAGAAAANVWSTAGEFVSQQALVATSETTTSGTFVDLATAGPSVTLTVGASGKVLIHLACQIQNSGANQGFVGIDVSGANTIAAATYLSTSAGDGASVKRGSTHLFTGLSTGSTTFKLQYAVGGGTGTFQGREIIAVPFI